MKKPFIITILSFSIFTLITFITCKKEDSPKATSEQGVSVTTMELQSDAVWDDVYKSSQSVMSYLESSNYGADTKSMSLISCYGVTIDKPGTTDWPKTITVTFNNCTMNGIKKNGTMTMTLSNAILTEGSVRTITLTDFTVNDTIQVEGTKTVEYLGKVNEKPTFRVTIKDGKITYNNTAYVTRNVTRTITWKQGYDLSSLSNLSDDVFAIYEKASGKTSLGFDYSAVTTDSLEFNLQEACIRKGTVQVKVANRTYNVDYTRDNCTDAVKVTSGDESFDIDLGIYIIYL